MGERAEQRGRAKTLQHGRLILLLIAASTSGGAASLSQLGTDIAGTINEAEFGNALALSSDGSRLVVGDNPSSQPRAKVFGTAARRDGANLGRTSMANIAIRRTIFSSTYLRTVSECRWESHLPQAPLDRSKDKCASLAGG